MQLFVLTAIVVVDISCVKLSENISISDSSYVANTSRVDLIGVLGAAQFRQEFKHKVQFWKKGVQFRGNLNQVYTVSYLPNYAPENNGAKMSQEWCSKSLIRSSGQMKVR